MILSFTESIDSISSVFENSLNKASTDLMDSMTEFIEMYESTHYITEKRQEFIVTKIKKFISSVIVTLKNFKDSIKIEVSRASREIATDAKLHKMYADLVKMKNEGKTTVTVIDVWTLENDYKKSVNRLEKIVKKISKCEYKHVYDMDTDLSAYNKIIDDANETINKDYEKTTVKPIQTVMNFVEDELSGRSYIMGSIDDCIVLLEGMQNDVDLVEKKKAILGPDVVNRHVSIIRKIVTGVSKFIKGVIVKFMTMVILIF